jgi:hypothetical protein
VVEVVVEDRWGSREVVAEGFQKDFKRQTCVAPVTCSTAKVLMPESKYLERV